MDGKIVIETEKFTHVREIEGEVMIEVRRIYLLFIISLCLIFVKVTTCKYVFCCCFCRQLLVEVQNSSGKADAFNLTAPPKLNYKLFRLVL